MSSLDPRADLARQGLGATAGIAGGLTALERRVATLERAQGLQTGTAAPSQPTRDGVPYGQGGATPRLWLRIDGAWRYTNLT